VAVTAEPAGLLRYFPSTGGTDYDVVAMVDAFLRCLNRNSRQSVTGIVGSIEKHTFLGDVHPL
jgi:hypothetical protein